MEEIARRADVAVEARALDSWSQWNPQHTIIYTYTKFAVEKNLKNAAGDAILVRQMGGSAGGYTQKVSGVRPWQPGERAALFLQRSNDNSGALVVVGLMQGNFLMRQEPSGDMTVSNGVPGAAAFDRNQHTVGSYHGQRMTLRELEARVQKAAQ